VRFKVDENLPVELAEPLRASGYDAATVLEQHHGGSADAELAALCQAENRILVTLDMDFADIRAYPPSGFPGLIVLRLRRHDKLHVLRVFTRTLALLLEDPLVKGCLWIVEEDRVRIRE